MISQNPAAILLLSSDVIRNFNEEVKHEKL